MHPKRMFGENDKDNFGGLYTFMPTNLLIIRTTDNSEER